MYVMSCGKESIVCVYVVCGHGDGCRCVCVCVV